MNKIIIFHSPDLAPVESESTPLVRPGRYYPSRYTSEKYYAPNRERGMAVIFNNVKFDKSKNKERWGSEKDATDLELVLEELGFTVKIHNDKTKDEIRKILIQCTYPYK